ncbi:hypothetical protein [Vulcanococcus sp. DEBay_Sum29NL08_54]|jgi:type II secretory pathway component PulJ|uniref:hypothetical protein n=1 Tax=Vulcanococcus sp. DEBay_Sum29NL08_54 TaxID=2806303 RepID=UPI0025D2FCF1|nr:hypothetical protein [Vulcanococcus sp. DEBay_Sum29NL08_54]
MPLLEVMLSCVIWSGALAAGLQLWGRGASQQQSNAQRATLIQEIERDRLRLIKHWRSLPPRSCSDGDQRFLETVAKDQPTAPGLRRVLELSTSEPGLWVRWSSADGSTVLRERLVTAAGLGLCTQEELA